MMQTLISYPNIADSDLVAVHQLPRTAYLSIDIHFAEFKERLAANIGTHCAIAIPIGDANVCLSVATLQMKLLPSTGTSIIKNVVIAAWSIFGEEAVVSNPPAYATGLGVLVQGTKWRVPEEKAV